MTSILVLGFTKSECLLKKSLFAQLFPACSLDFADEWHYDERKPFDKAIIQCGFSEARALEHLQKFAKSKIPVLLYAERLPSAPFVLFVQDEPCASLLFAPAHITEIAECAESLAHGKRFVSKTVLSLSVREEANRLFSYDSLSRTDRILVFGLYAGLSMKEIAALAGVSEHHASVNFSRLKEKHTIFDRREFVQSMMDWLM